MVYSRIAQSAGGNDWPSPSRVHLYMWTPPLPPWEWNKNINVRRPSEHRPSPSLEHEILGVRREMHKIVSGYPTRFRYACGSVAQLEPLLCRLQQCSSPER